MSYIVEQLNKYYLSKIKTTKDLIYKDKIIDPHDIAGSYEKRHKEDPQNWFKFKYLHYKNTPIYLNPSYFTNAMAGLTALYHLSTESIGDVKNNELIKSEIQNSLWIEGVRSSKKKVSQTLKNPNKRIHEEIDQIIQNYKIAIDFIQTTKSINEDNLYILYKLLSKDIDMGDETLDGMPYRQDQVEIGNNTGIDGVAPENIKKHMDAIFAFINLLDNQLEKTFAIISPFLFHYLFEIIHPYYDMNGRTGRLFALWLSFKFNTAHTTAFLSQSVNKFKHKLYYGAFNESIEKNFKNDPTFFIASMMVSITANNIAIAIANGMKQKLELEKKVTLSQLELDILESLLSKKDDQTYLKEQFILGVDEITPSLLTKAFQNLINHDLIIEVNTKPKKYAINWTKEIKENIENFVNPKLVFVEK